MPPSLLADPFDHAPLRSDGAILRNDAGLWPILGGLPVLVPNPVRWLAAHRDAVLAALAEVGRVDRAAVDDLDVFASQVRGVAPEPLPDDFLDDEDAPVEIAWLSPPGPSLAERVAADCGDGPILEVGCGSGALTRRLRGRPLVVVDRSPRALLRATADLDAVPVLGDAHALPVLSGAFATVVAANVVDLLDDPATFLDEVALALRPGGRFVCTTPDPALGVSHGSDEALVDLIEAAGLRIVSDEDDLPWLRVHGPRHVQVYAVRKVVAAR